jgi:hypothetical protein
MFSGFLSRIIAGFVRKDHHSDVKRRKIMLNIFADALLIAARLGQLPKDANHRTPHEFQDIEALRTVTTLRHTLR